MIGGKIYIEKTNHLFHTMEISVDFCYKYSISLPPPINIFSQTGFSYKGKHHSSNRKQVFPHGKTLFVFPAHTIPFGNGAFRTSESTITAWDYYTPHPEINHSHLGLPYSALWSQLFPCRMDALGI